MIKGTLPQPNSSQFTKKNNCATYAEKQNCPCITKPVLLIDSLLVSDIFPTLLNYTQGEKLPFILFSYLLFLQI